MFDNRNIAYVILLSFTKDIFRRYVFLFRFCYIDLFWTKMFYFIYIMFHFIAVLILKICSFQELLLGSDKNAFVWRILWSRSNVLR